MATTVRVTVTVPKDLKARMDAIDEAVNWSAVASRAFEQTLADIISRRGVKQVEDVINRLRASKQRLAAGMYRDGFEAGRSWAEQTAEADELERLADIGTERWADMFGSADSNCAYGPGELFVFTVIPAHDGDRIGASDFWSGIAGDEGEAVSNNPEFVRGFAEGAYALWREVEDKL